MSNDCFQLLDKRVLVRSTSQDFAVDLRRLFRSFPVTAGDSASADLTFSVIVSPPSSNRTTRPFHYVYRDDVRAGRTTNYWHIFRLLEWQTNLFMGEEVERFFLLHAGTVAINGVGIVFPAPSESGKTSLTMALTRRGYRYMSDEFAVIDSQTGELHPFPKPLSVKNISIFPDLARRENIWVGPKTGERGVELDASAEVPVWYVHPEDVSRNPTGDPVPVGFVIFPRYAPNEKPRIEPVTAGEAARKLIENSVNFHRFGGEGLRVVAQLAQAAQCFSLTINDLDTTTTLIDELTTQSP